jgi:hypothetical protein
MLRRYRDWAVVSNEVIRAVVGLVGPRPAAGYKSYSPVFAGKHF